MRSVTALAGAAVGFLLCLSATAAPPADRPTNLAPLAKVSASSQYNAQYAPAGAVDGKIPGPLSRADTGMAWVTHGATAKGAAEFVLQWDQPLALAQVIYYGRCGWMIEECFKDYEVYLDAAEKPVAKGQLAVTPDGQPINFPPAKASRLRIKFLSAHGGLNAGASEIEVYSQPVANSAIRRFDVTLPAPTPSRAPRGAEPNPVKPAPQWLDDLKAAKFGFSKLLVIQRRHIDCSHVYTYHAEGQRDGGGLFVMDLADGSLRKILDSSAGQVLSYDLSFDGQELLVAWRKGRQYHIYRMKTDGSDVRQLTSGQHDNFDPVWLPDGDIAFLSTRTPLVAYCWTSYCGVLHRMKPDGGDVRRISFNYLNDFTPSLMNDGRLIYGRWEYVDRPAIPIQSLWTINPDGTKVEGWFGNRVLDPATFIEARALPGTQEKIICTLTGHNGTLKGAVGLIDRHRGDNAQESITNLTPDVRLVGVDKSSNGPRGPYMTPYPLDPQFYLVSRDGTILLRDVAITGEAVVLPARDGMIFTYPQPLRARPRPIVRPALAPSSFQATVYVQDVYAGLEPHVQRGQIKRIMVVEELAKPSIAQSTGFGFQRPVVSCGATYVPKKVWGFADVAEDGSAAFEVPAQTPIYFLPLDEQGRAVQRMRTFTHLMPGETQGCVGCHDSHVAAPQVLPPRASLGRRPRPLAAPEWGVRGFDYASIVQPVLDKHCVTCHNHKDAPGRIDLSPDRTQWFNVSYDVLAWEGTKGLGGNPYTSWISTMNGHEANILMIAPKAWGSPRSKLADLILAGHPDDKGKPRIALSADERQRILTWIDVNVPYYGTSTTTHPGLQGGRALASPELRKVLQEVSARRCASCHSGPADPAAKKPGPVPLGRVRFTNPHHNAFLVAPLAKSAGGSEKCGRAVFADTQDADYQKLLSVFDPIAALLKDNPRQDMPGAKLPACEQPLVPSATCPAK